MAEQNIIDTFLEQMGPLPDEEPAAAPQETGGADKEAERRINLMGFRLGEEEYAVDIMRIREITPVLEMTPIPRAPGYISGVVSLRGNITPIFDPKKKIGLRQTERTHRSRIIVLNRDEEQVGIVVDAITGAATVPMGSIEPPPPVIRGHQADYISGVARDDDRMLIVMDIDAVTQVEGVRENGERVPEQERTEDT
jgi:purine-binding chemotaxis protein CheW